MKRIFLLIPVSALFLLTACSLPTSQTSNTTMPSDEMEYTQELTIAGLGPDVSFEPTVSADTLVLRHTFIDHSDHVFIDRQLRSNYLDIQDDVVPGNIVKFSGKVKALDAAAGNHYYQVLSVDKLTKIGTPTQEKVEELITQYGYCETDEDCVVIYGTGPLPCHIARTNKYQD